MDVSGSRWRIQFVCELAIFVNWHSTIPANYAAARSICVRARSCVCVLLYAACVAARAACHLRSRREHVRAALIASDR